MLCITRLCLCRHVAGCVNKVVVVCLRYAITVWYFDSVERAEAKRRFRDLTGTNTPRASPPPPSPARSPPLLALLFLTLTLPLPLLCFSSAERQQLQLTVRTRRPLVLDCPTCRSRAQDSLHLWKLLEKLKEKIKKRLFTVCWRGRPACCERRSHLTSDAFRWPAAALDFPASPDVCAIISADFENRGLHLKSFAVREGREMEDSVWVYRHDASVVETWLFVLFSLWNNMKTLVLCF